MTKTIETITAKIYLGLKRGNTEKVQDIEELKDFLQKSINKPGVYFTITPTTFVCKDERETGAVIGLINYSRIHEPKESIKQTAEEIAILCMEKYRKNKIAIEYQNQTIMFE